MFSNNNFFVTQQDPKLIKNQILQFWEENLPGTPIERFEWLCNGNPAGPAVWFCLNSKNSGDIVAITSVMPRNLYYNSRLIKAGIVGDFMININFRGMGLAHKLQDTVFTDYPKYGFNMLYTVPNDNAGRALRKAGFKDAGVLREYLRPISYSYYLEKFMKIPLLLKMIILLVEKLSRNINRIPKLFNTDGRFIEVTELDDSFDIFWNEYREEFKGIIGDHSMDYIEWKYFKNPENQFRLISERSLTGEKLLGYVIFTILNNKLYIYDMIGKNNDCTGVFNKLVQISYKEKCLGIYLSSLKDIPLQRGIKTYGFLKTKNDSVVLMVGKEDIICDKYYVFSGDRNI